MKSFDLEAGRRFREEGDIAEALRCLRSAVDDDRDNVDAYIELGLTYVLAFEDSGDPLCLDSARKVCLSGLRRNPSESQRRRLIELQDRVEDLVLESAKAEADALTDAMTEVLRDDVTVAGDSDLASDASQTDDVDLLIEDPEDPTEGRGH